MSTEHEQAPLDEILPRDSGADRGPIDIDIPRPTLDREIEKPAVSERLSEAKRIADELEAENRMFKAAQERDGLVAQQQEAERQQREFAQFEAELQADQQASDPNWHQKMAKDALAAASDAKARAQYGNAAVEFVWEELQHALDTNHPHVGIMRQKIAQGMNPADVAMEWFDHTGGVRNRPLPGEARHQSRRSIADHFPSNLAGARNVGRRMGPAWSGPTPLNDIFKR
jgi:hypothetical protein